jgi:FkbM family methyltransferase
VRKLDTTRVVLRSLINTNLYGKVAMIVNASRVILQEGYSTYRTLVSPGKAGEVRLVTPKKYRYPNMFRPGTEDVYTIIDTIIDSYRLPVQFNPKFIIDGGAYIGDSSIWFLNHFPRCKVVALEPNVDNHRLAETNLAHYGERVVLMKIGLWNCKTRLRVTDDFLGARIARDDEFGNEFETIDVDSLMEECGAEEIDLLKLNVEGAELQIITDANASFLSKTKLMVVQFHGQEVEERCLRHLEMRGFEGYIYRTFYYFINRSLD